MLTSTPEITKFVYSVLVTDKLERIVKGLEENKYNPTDLSKSLNCFKFKVQIKLKT